MADQTTSIKLDPALKARIKKLAANQRRSPHWLMREAIEQYVTQAEQQEKLRQDILAAWQDYQSTGLHVTGEEADDWMKRLESGEDLKPPAAHK
jgi:predicted transcriptional regulator